MKDETIDTERRKFLKISSLATSSLFIGFHIPDNTPKANAADLVKKNPDPTFAPNAWIRIDTDNGVTIMVNHSEMGQGISTALPMIVAEELEADWSKVRPEIAPVDKVYENPAFGTQWTVSSTSVETSWEILRTAGAGVRELLIEAAARIWKVSKTSCRARKSMVYHELSGRSLSYGELITKTQGIPIPENLKLKEPHEFKIIGQPIPRLDTRIKTIGSAIFGMDVKIPGMFIATVVHPPFYTKKIKTYDFENALASPGVRHVLVIDNGVAIVADTFWQADAAVHLLEIEWDTSNHQDISSESLFKRWAQMAKEKGKTCFEAGDVDRYFQKSNTFVEAAYEVPFQAHATPEPMNCTAHVRKDGCDIWAPTQNQDGAQDIAAKITNLSHGLIKVHTTFIGGGFGRRALVDYVEEAVQISQKIQAPVKVIWTREEDMQHDYYRPATYNVLKAVLNDQGLPLAWNHKIVGSEVFAQALPKAIPGFISSGVPRFLKNMAAALARSLVPRFISTKKVALGAGPLDYDIANLRVEFIHDDPGIPVCWWRSVAHSSNCFAVECFIDEIAAASGTDPYDLRQALLVNSPRMLHVLKLAASMAGWKTKPATDIYRGMATHNFQNTALCFIAEVSIIQNAYIKVHRMVCAVDCGIVINPKIVEAQIQSGIVFGLSATLKSAITLEHGKILERNFDDFPILRMDEMPEVEVHIVQSTNPPTGIGEVAVPLVAPAVANAVFSALGKPVRRLPINL